MTGGDERNPYVGPREFKREDQHLFFGRDREASELLALILAHPVVLFYAQSGAGKTSLINARLIPLLEGEQFEVFPKARVSGVLPEGVELESVANLYVYNTLLGWMLEGDSPQRLASLPLAAFLQERPPLRDEFGDERPRLLIFDQFEELFTLYPDRWLDREAFFQQVAEALAQNPLLRVMFTIREDYLAQIEPHARWLPGLLRARYRMERLRREPALEAITRPLEATPRSFTRQAAERLVDSLLKVRMESGEGGTTQVMGEFVEPVQLQVVCRTLWEKLPSRVKQITERQLQRRLGDIDTAVDRALQAFYQQTIDAAAAQTGYHQNILRQWCQVRLITATGTRSIVHREPQSTAGLPNEVVQILEDSHLIRSEWRAGAHWYELAHDRFIGPIQTSNERWFRECERRSKQCISLLRRAEQQMLKSMYQEAEGALREALQTSEDIGDPWAMAQAYSSLGKLHQAQGCDQEAIAAYSTALDLQRQMDDPQGQAYLLAVLGPMLHDSEQYEQAIDCYTDYISLVPGDPFGYAGRAAAFWYAGRLAEAARDFTQELKWSTEPLHAYSGRGQVYAEMGRYKRAIRDLDRAIELAGDEPVTLAYARNGRALAYAGLGQYGLSLEEFERSIEGCPDNAWVYYNRAFAYEWMAQYDKAIADLETALVKQNPRLTPLKRERAEARLQALKERGQ